MKFKGPNYLTVKLEGFLSDIDAGTGAYAGPYQDPTGQTSTKKCKYMPFHI
jgi:hypothetical protein